MTDKELEKIEDFYRKKAHEIAHKYWGIEFTCPIVFINRKWKRLNASFRVWEGTDKCEIRLNYLRAKEYGEEEYLKILKHEMVHWYLWRLDKPYGDLDEGFIRECIRIGAGISGTKSAVKAYENIKEDVGEAVRIG